MAPVARYTRFVALSKHFLWILVAVIIGIVIWIASDNNASTGARIVFSNIPKSENLQNEMSKPHFQGLDSRQQPYTVMADKATQIDDDNVALDKVRADMAMENGEWAALMAGSGKINLESKQLRLENGVNLFYEGGYEFRSKYAEVDIDKGTAEGDTPVEGQGPLGTIKADSFSIGENGKVIRFNGSVRMKLYPGK